MLRIQIIISIIFAVSLTFPAYAIDDQQEGRWVNFGMTGGQPQGGVAVTPNKSVSGHEIVLTTGDVTGLRKSVTEGTDWFMANDPVSPAMFKEYGVMAIDHSTFANGVEGDEAIYIAKLSADQGDWSEPFKLIRSVDGGTSFQNIENIDAAHSKLRYFPISIAPASETGKALFAISEGGVASLYLLERISAAAKKLVLPPDGIGMIFDVKALTDHKAIITTDKGVYAITDYSTLQPLSDPALGGDCRYMYVNPAYPDVIWLTKKLSNSDGQLLRSSDAGASWQVVNASLGFRPGLLAAFGGTPDGTGARILIGTESLDNPYAQGAFNTNFHYSTGGQTFQPSFIPPNDGSDPGYPIRGGGNSLNQVVASPTSDDYSGNFYVARFGGFMRSTDGGATFTWQNRGIYGLTIFNMLYGDNTLTVTTNDHGIFQSHAGTGSDLVWRNLLYDNWRQLDEKITAFGVTLGSGSDVIIDPVDSNILFYIKYSGTNWYIRRAGNGAPTVNDWENIFSSDAWSGKYKIQMVLDYEERWKNNREVLVVITSRPDKGDDSNPVMGVVRLENNNGAWTWSPMNTGLSILAQDSLKDIKTDLYGNIYIRTGVGGSQPPEDYEGIWKYNRTTASWEHKVVGFNEGASNLEAISFDQTDANLVYAAVWDKIWFSNNFGEQFTEWANMPAVEEFGAASNDLYHPRALLAHGDDLYAGINLSKPYMVGGNVMHGGVLYTHNAGLSWQWLNRHSMPAAEIGHSLLLAPDGQLYAGDDGSGLARYEIIIDNQDKDATKPYYFEATGGPWAESTSIDEAAEFGPEVRNPRGSIYRQGGAGESATAIWHFRVPRDGVYKVYAWWNRVQGSTMESNALYRIAHAPDRYGHTSTVAIRDQSLNSGRWNELAIVSLNADTNYQVALESGSQSAATVNADAVRVERYQPEIVVDNEDSGFTFNGMSSVDHFNSPWKYPYGPQSGNAPTSRHGNASGGTRWARWYFTVPASGKYTVSAWWPTGPSWQSAGVVYRIHHGEDGGIPEFTDSVNQQQNRSRWNTLTVGGTREFQFYTGETYYVEIREEDQKDTGHFNADAINVVLTSTYAGEDHDGDGVSDHDERCFDGDCNNYNPYHAINNPDGTDLDVDNVDTDGDGYPDAEEIAYGSNPLDFSDIPDIGADYDVNMDGEVDAADVLLAQRHILGLATLNASQTSHGDVYPVPAGDGKVTLSDMLLIMRKALSQP